MLLLNLFLQYFETERFHLELFGASAWQSCETSVSVDE